MMGRVKGKVALVTGAAQGIGKACAQLLAKEGAFVFLTDVKDDAGKKAAAGIGSAAVYMHLDVCDEKEWEKVIKLILKQKGHLDILVNNAGIIGLEKGFGPEDPENASLESWRRVNAVNSEGVFLGCKHAIRAMKKSGGSIINMSSRSGLVGIPDAAPYAASKAAVRNHSKSVALYCCQKGYSIRCNSVHPGPILTPLWDPMLGTGSERKKRIAQIAHGVPMQRMGTPEDVAPAVVFLASDESKYITGIELNIDGGVLAGSASSPKKLD
jgi:NAD(P)-dependent dehydrogenase (short-subunit alcohol dehydrogenase family)